MENNAPKQHKDEHHTRYRSQQGLARNETREQDPSHDDEEAPSGDYRYAGPTTSAFMMFRSALIAS